MKKTAIIYWISTIVFAGLMLSSAIPNALATPEWVALFAMLGYPKYLVSFLGIAKILGVIAILIPGFPRIKEWAYAGLAFDLIGVVYSSLAMGPFNPQMLFMLIWIVPGIVSYIYHHKKLKLKQP
ncbi:MAG: DoxX-like family protein [Flavipsychrobacter sp.]|jgi:hypothetical protein|nr:DoxX-like family protein [Flavipsychrobacter sp.]